MTGLYVELWLRSLAGWTVGRDGTFVEDLELLDERGVVADYEVAMWDGFVPLDEGGDLTPREAGVRDRVRSYRRWADERGADLPAFARTRTVPDPAGGSRTLQVLPIAVLAGYDADGLAWVAPHAVDGEHVSVQDKLDELARQERGRHDGSADRGLVGAE